MGAVTMSLWCKQRLKPECAFLYVSWKAEFSCWKEEEDLGDEGRTSILKAWEKENISLVLWV